MRDETRLLQSGAGNPPFSCLSTPLIRASTVIFPTVDSFLRRQEQFYDGFTYALYGHPVSRELEARLSTLAGGTHTLAVPSGLAAIALTLMTTLRHGDHVLVPDTVYGPARMLCGGLLRGLGIETTFYDPHATRELVHLIRPQSKLVWVETPGSLTMEMQDLPAIADIAHSYGCLVAVDNSWASSLLHKPLRLGADIVVEALSKHVGGHSDLILGAVTVADDDLFRRLKDTARFLGYGASPDDCWLALRGLESLGPRLRQQGASALEVATWLARHPLVRDVLHPALATHKGHDIWLRDFEGSSGVFSVVFDRVPKGPFHHALESLDLFRLGASFGGVHSLVAPSSPGSSRSVVPWSSDGPLVRFSIGLEHPADLIADLERALDRLQAAMT
ncbi:trans-sulfuration enzyme family protein [Alsobacter sp. R-9]